MQTTPERARLSARPPHIVIGGSVGSQAVLRTLVAHLPAGLPAVIAVVVHIPPSVPSHLASILQRRSRLPVYPAVDGILLQPGSILVAPPAHHLLFADDHARVVRGPKEHRFRPAIDPLFRSAAAVAGPQAIGVVLSGGLADGAAGLASIKAHGGIAIVQDPRDAAAPWMPLAALRAVTSDYTLSAHALAPVLMKLVDQMAVTAQRRCS